MTFEIYGDVNGIGFVYIDDAGQRHDYPSVDQILPEDRVQTDLADLFAKLLKKGHNEARNLPVDDRRRKKRS